MECARLRSPRLMSSARPASELRRSIHSGQPVHESVHEPESSGAVHAAAVAWIDARVVPSRACTRLTDDFQSASSGFESQAAHRVTPPLSCANALGSPQLCENAPEPAPRNRPIEDPGDERVHKRRSANLGGGDGPLRPIDAIVASAVRSSIDHQLRRVRCDPRVVTGYRSDHVRGLNASGRRPPPTRSRRRDDRQPTQACPPAGLVEVDGDLSACIQRHVRHLVPGDGGTIRRRTREWST